MHHSFLMSVVMQMPLHSAFLHIASLLPACRTCDDTVNVKEYVGRKSVIDLVILQYGLGILQRPSFSAILDTAVETGSSLSK